MSYLPDTIVLFVVVLGPGFLSLPLTVMARKCVKNVLLHAVCGVIALVLLVVRGLLLVGAMVMVAGYQGNLLRNPFTLAGSVGFVVSLASLLSYFVRPSASATPGE